MNNSNNPYDIEIGPIAKEIGAIVRIQYHTATIEMTTQQLDFLAENGLKTDIMSCIMAAFVVFGGKDEEELMTFLEEAAKAKAAPNLTFEAPEGGELKVSDPECNPELDKMVRAVEAEIAKEGK